MRTQRATKSSKKYKGVYCDDKGKIFYQVDLGIDPVTGKRLQKKARKNQFANQDTDFIISRFGDPFCKSTIYRIIKRKAQPVGVPVITEKGLIHSHASYLINVLKEDILYVARRMEHADKSTTLNTYSHWFNALDKNSF